MSSTSLQLSRKYGSLSGCDIRIVIAGQTLGVAQALSYGVQREKSPVYVAGRPDPIAFSRGKRGIAGNLISLMLDRHILFQPGMNSLRFLARNDEIVASPFDANNASPLGAAGLPDLTDLAGGNAGSYQYNAGDISSNYTVAQPWYLDQVPPMDFVCVGVNEYGNAASMRIYGAECLNEGSGFSVDQMVIENQITYVATHMYPWQQLGTWDLDNGGGFTPGPTLPVSP